MRLPNLLKFEFGSLVKMSKLTETAVYPELIERQHVNLRLQVFYEETATPLELLWNQCCLDDCEELCDNHQESFRMVDNP